MRGYGTTNIVAVWLDTLYGGSTFEPLNNGLIGYLRDLVESAIIRYEPRVVLENIEVTPVDSFELIEGQFKILVDYRVGQTNSRFNFVYDFYLREANNSPI